MDINGDSCMQNAIKWSNFEVTAGVTDSCPGRHQQIPHLGDEGPRVEGVLRQKVAHVSAPVVKHVRVSVPIIVLVPPWSVVDVTIGFYRPLLLLPHSRC